jgi:predicted nucleic acid-binding protein
VSTKICVDASLILKLFLDEEDSDKVRSLWIDWLAADVDLVAPCHLAFEVPSVIRQKVHQRALNPEVAEQALETFPTLNIALLHPQSMLASAWKMAQRFNRPTVYDAYYLAVGEIYGCEVWTADRRLYRAVQHELPWVKLLDFYRPSTPN